VMTRDTRRMRLVLALLLLTSFTLLTIDYRTYGRSPLRPLERAVAAVVGPGERLVAAGVRPLQNVIHLGDDKKRIAALQRDNDKLRVQAEATENDRRRAAELDQ